jgi:hypothetical protein
MALAVVNFFEIGIVGDILDALRKNDPTSSVQIAQELGGGVDAGHQQGGRGQFRVRLSESRLRIAWRRANVTRRCDQPGAERYGWLNKILAVGVGERLPPNIVDIRDCKRLKNDVYLARKVAATSPGRPPIS